MLVLAAWLAVMLAVGFHLSLLASWPSLSSFCLFALLFALFFFSSPADSLYQTFLVLSIHNHMRGIGASLYSSFCVGRCRAPRPLAHRRLDPFSSERQTDREREKGERERERERERESCLLLLSSTGRYSSSFLHYTFCFFAATPEPCSASLPAAAAFSMSVFL